jgi:PAS domain S-box-containing protein
MLVTVERQLSTGKLCTKSEMIKSKVQYFFRPAFDIVMILTLIGLSYYVLLTKDQIDAKYDQLLEGIIMEKELPVKQPIKGSYLVIRGNDANVNKASAPRVTLKEIETELEFATRRLHNLAWGAIVLAVLLMTGYKSQEYFFFTKPKKQVVSQLASSLSGSEQSKDEYSNSPALTELVSDLLTSREESQRFVKEMTNGNFDYHPQFTKTDSYTSALLSMQNKLHTASVEEKKMLWMSESTALLERTIKDGQDQHNFFNKLISFITHRLSTSCIGAIYTFCNEPKDEAHFLLLGSYGYPNISECKKIILAGEGQLGQLALEKKPVQIDNIPSKHLSISSGLGSSPAIHITICPLIFKDQLYGALELASLQAISDYQLQWLERAGESIGAYLFNKKVTAEAQAQLEKLAEQQAAELVQLHALQRETNERLQKKLKEAEEEKLKNQAILEGCVDAVVSFNSDGTIIFCNHALTEILEMSREEVMAMNMFSIAPVAIRHVNGKLRPFYQSDRTEKEIQLRTEAVMMSSTGTTVDVLITSAEVSVNAGTFFTFFIQKISVDLF